MDHVVPEPLIINPHSTYRMEGEAEESTRREMYLDMKSE